LVLALKIAVPVALVALLWRAVDWGAAFDLMQRANPVWLGAALVVLTLQTLLSAQRWRITAAQLGLTLSYRTAVRDYYLAQVVNQSLPGGVVGDAGRAVRHRGAAGLLISAQAVMFERLAGQIGMLAVLCFGLAVSVVVPTGMVWPLWLTAPLGATLAGLAAVPVVLWGLAKFIGPSGTPLRQFIQAFKHAVAARNVLAAQIALSLGTAICNVLAFALCAAALGLTLPLVVIATLVPLILFAMLMPFSIGGWGYREGAAALLFPLIGATSSAGLATSVTFGLMFLFSMFPGLLMSWMWPNSVPPDDLALNTLTDIKHRQTKRIFERKTP